MAVIIPQQENRVQQVYVLNVSQSDLRQDKTMLKPGWKYGIYVCFTYKLEDTYSLLIAPNSFHLQLSLISSLER